MRVKVHMAEQQGEQAEKSLCDQLQITGEELLPAGLSHAGGQPARTDGGAGHGVSQEPPLSASVRTVYVGTSFHRGNG